MTDATNFNDIGSFPQQGWQCPVCKNIYSPTIPECYKCNGGTNIPTSDSGTGKPPKE